MNTHYDPKKNPFSYKAEIKEEISSNKKGNVGLIIWLIIAALVVIISLR